jgi:hypothetical protein
MSDQLDLIDGLASVLETHMVGEKWGPDRLAESVVRSDWLADVRSESFWTGVRALADLTGMELDDYTRQNIVDPYRESGK